MQPYIHCSIKPNIYYNRLDGSATSSTQTVSNTIGKMEESWLYYYLWAEPFGKVLYAAESRPQVNTAAVQQDAQEGVSGTGIRDQL